MGTAPAKKTVCSSHHTPNSLHKVLDFQKLTVRKNHILLVCVAAIVHQVTFWPGIDISNAKKSCRISRTVFSKAICYTNSPMCVGHFNTPSTYKQTETTRISQTNRCTRISNLVKLRGKLLFTVTFCYGTFSLTCFATAKLSSADFFLFPFLPHYQSTLIIVLSSVWFRLSCYLH